MTDTPFVSAAVPTDKPVGYDRRFYLAAWRWHFYAGLYVVPFMIMLAVTGMMMMFIGYFDGREGEKISVSVPENAVVLAVSEQAKKALATIPDGKMVQWLSPRSNDMASVFQIKSGPKQTMVAVNPYTGDIVDSWNRRSGWYDLADTIHGDLMIGFVGDRLIEISAGLGIVMIITGLYLWWPRNMKLGAALFPSLRQKGRALWKDLHASIGVYVSLILLMFLLTGMAWTGVWGGKIVQPWGTFPIEKSKKVPLSDVTYASLDDGGVSTVPWTLEQARMPASGSAAGIIGIAPGEPVSIDTVSNLATRLDFKGRYRISAPKNKTGVWTISQNTMSADAQDPMSDRTVHVDRYTGRILADIGFNAYPLGGQVMAVGIPFHMGLMGLWNLVLNTLSCLAILFLSVSGIVMWWMRRPKKAALRMFAPQVPADRPHWRAAMIIMLAVSMAFPLAGVTLLGVMALDLLILSRIPFLRKAFA